MKLQMKTQEQLLVSKEEENISLRQAKADLEKKLKARDDQRHDQLSRLESHQVGELKKQLQNLTDNLDRQVN